MQIEITDKILIIAPHPDDEVIACGGFIAKYHKQIDILCVNSSGIQYSGETLSAEEIAEVRCNEFRAVAQKAKVNKVYIEKLWGKPVMIDEMTEHYKNYMEHFNMKDYDIILVPHKNDDHPEHRFVGNLLLKDFLNIQGYKKDLKILRYELWSPLTEVNYYEDITDFVDTKRELIESYKIRDGRNYSDRIIALNKYRTLKPFFANKEKYVEAFYIENLDEYMQIPDIINQETDSEYKNEKMEYFLQEQNAQKKIDEISLTYKDKKIVLYGAGEFSRCIFKHYNLSALNIIGIADKRFEQKRPHEFYGLTCLKPEDLKNIDCDVILVSNYDFIKFERILKDNLLSKSKNKNVDIKQLIKAV